MYSGNTEIDFGAYHLGLGHLSGVLPSQYRLVVKRLSLFLCLGVFLCLRRAHVFLVSVNREPTCLCECERTCLLWLCKGRTCECECQPRCLLRLRRVKHVIVSVKRAPSCLLCVWKGDVIWDGGHLLWGLTKPTKPACEKMDDMLIVIVHGVEHAYVTVQYRREFSSQWNKTRIRDIVYMESWARAESVWALE
jgi:hypothetical protein